MTGGEDGRRGMAAPVLEWLEGVPWMLGPLLGRAPRGKHLCDARRLLVRFLPPSCSARKFFVAGMNRVGHNSSEAVMQIPSHNDTLSCASCEQMAQRRAQDPR